MDIVFEYEEVYHEDCTCSMSRQTSTVACSTCKATDVPTKAKNEISMCANARCPGLMNAGSPAG